MDPNSGCKEGTDSPPKGPDTRPPRQCALSNMCNDFQALGHWWKVNLQKLRTDIVRCPVKTQHFEAAFTADCLDLNTTSSADQSQPSSLERIAKRFEPVPDLLHPAPQMTVPPPPVFPNLPTPQTTPQTNLNCWTPKSNDQLSRPSMRCRASTSALGSAFRKHCPMANLERCPPPKPRSSEQESRSCILPPVMPHAIPSTVSVTSSPESIVSDAASCAPRSRSSSISSTASWMTNLPAAIDVIGGSKDGYIVSHELQRAMLQYTNQRPRRPPISRLQNPCSQLVDPAPTVLGGPQVVPVLPDHKRGEHPFREHVLDEGYASADEAKKHGTVEVLAGLYIDTSTVDEGVVFSRAIPKPALGRSKTHVVNTARQEQVPRTQLMKRTHSESTDFADPAQHVAAFTASGNTGKVDYSTCFIPRAYLNTLTENEEILQPTQCWAEPRKPVQARTQGKRMCLSGMDTIHGVC
ncbi:PHO85 cyclin-5 [Lithohypha guttulata]|nr:PHO85 cyclin-5 [Lithohypha guttulata]